MSRTETLKIGFPAYWGGLVPSLQHTGYADALMVNQFEALVTTGKGGITKPLAAKSWTVSDDYRLFTFLIDTERKFSNGQNLSAHDFKRSWEYGLALDPKSTNSSLLDVMYRVVGFEDFKNSGELKGVRVINDSTLQIEFKEPFRMALNHLAGSRMSAFVRVNEVFLGTGPYILRDVENKLYFTKNPHSKEDVGFEKIEVLVVPPSEASMTLNNGQIDLYALAEFADIKECFDENSLIDCYSGSEARHQRIVLNGIKGRFFDNKNHRLAFQSLVHRIVTKDKLPTYHRFNLSLDPQIYLPLQIGRLDEKLVNELINVGTPYVDSLIKATKTTPLYLVTSEESNWLQPLLEKEGIRFARSSGQVDMQERIKMYYKTHEPDLILSAFSVASGDPDGIYHSLGKHGSISSPMQYRESVGLLLEEGRKILNLEKADEHYKRVAIESLKEVPFVHLGFTKTVVAFRKDRVQVKSKYKKRDDGRFSIYEAL